MATVTFASSNPTLHTFFTLDDNPPGHPREASFSSYLSAGDGIFSLRLSGEVNDQLSLGGLRKKAVAAAHDDELDIFGAEKYFNGGMDAAAEAGSEQEKPCRPSPYKEAEHAGGRRTRPGTPSEFSEASGNSRSSLLRDARREKSSPDYPQRSPASCGKRFLGIFPCSCSDKSSVEVGKITKEDGGGGENPASRPPGASKQVQPEFCYGEERGWQRAAAAVAVLGPKREDCFSFPTGLSPVVVVGNSTVGAAKVLEEERKARIAAMDVFGTRTFLGKEEFAASLRRNTTILSPFPAAAKRDDDACSESSSDLFEIESLSTGTFPAAGGAAGGGTLASTRCYEPSEASIQWSVVTASAANLSVMGSDWEVSPPKGTKGDGTQQHRHQQRSGGGGGLMGCGSAKAVNVAPNGATHRVPPEKVEAGQRRRRHRSMDAVVPKIRYNGESPRSVDYEHGSLAAPAGHVLAARGIPRPITAAHVPRFQLPR